VLSADNIKCYQLIRFFVSADNTMLSDNMLAIIFVLLENFTLSMHYFATTYMSAKEVRLLHECGEDPAGVGEYVREEEVRVDLVPQAPQLSK
jgi:hypothetical protein